MKAVGVFTTALLAAAVAGAAVIGLRSIPDIKRYLEMRSM